MKIIKKLITIELSCQGQKVNTSLNRGAIKLSTLHVLTRSFWTHFSFIGTDLKAHLISLKAGSVEQKILDRPNPSWSDSHIESADPFIKLLLTTDILVCLANCALSATEEKTKRLFFTSLFSSTPEEKTQLIKHKQSVVGVFLLVNEIDRLCSNFVKEYLARSIVSGCTDTLLNSTHLIHKIYTKEYQLWASCFLLSRCNLKSDSECLKECLFRLTASSELPVDKIYQELVDCKGEKELETSTEIYTYLYSLFSDNEGLPTEINTNDPFILISVLQIEPRKIRSYGLKKRKKILKLVTEDACELINELGKEKCRPLITSLCGKKGVLENLRFKESSPALKDSLQKLDLSTGYSASKMYHERNKGGKRERKKTGCKFRE